LNRDIEYLNKFSIPYNLIHRSFYQYKCQVFQKNIIKNLINNVLALLLALPVIIVLLLKSVRLNNVKQNTHCQAIFIFSGLKNIVPIKLQQKYPDNTSVDFGKNWYLKTVDIKFIYKLKDYLVSPFFILKSIFKMSMYRALIDKFSPEAIICSSEYSFTSSLLTWYCEQHNIRHINVMHGEKLLNIRDSFFKFHECYVWDKHYIDLFTKLRADEKQFIIDLPPSLFIQNKTNFKHKHELTYYLSSETIDELKEIRETLLKIKIPDNKICIRPHPRYTNLILTNKIFIPYVIENPQEVTIEDSFNSTKIIASLYSTVLYQGYISGKQIVVDDLTQVEKFEKLKKLNYIIFSKPYTKMSELIDIS